MLSITVYYRKSQTDSCKVYPFGTNKEEVLANIWIALNYAKKKRSEGYEVEIKIR
jgi:hypothetical protein